MLWQVIIQRNMLVNNNIQKEVYPMIYSLALDLELGLKLFNQYAVRTKNTEAKLIIFAGLTTPRNPLLLRLSAERILLFPKKRRKIFLQKTT